MNSQQEGTRRVESETPMMPGQILIPKGKHFYIVLSFLFIEIASL